MTSVGDVTQLSPSLKEKCLCEFLGTTIGIYLGCSVIANALLPGAKGQSMGFGWIALGYGLAFFLPGVFFGHISANLNPAVCLADWILGNSSVAEFFALSASEIAGGIAGSILVWLHWLPHFKTVPEPPATNAGDNLLRKRDALPKNAIEIASYNPRPTGPAAAAAAAAQQAEMQQATTGTLGNSGTLRRRRRTGGGSSELATGGGGVSGSLPVSQAQGAGGRAGSGVAPAPSTVGGLRMGSGVLEAELKAALDKQKQLAKTVSRRVRRGVGGTIREWFVDFMYYAVHHDSYHKPDSWKQNPPLAGRKSQTTDGPGTPSTAQRYTSIHHGEEIEGGIGRLAPVMEDEESGFNSMRRQTQNGTVPAPPSGQGNGTSNQNDSEPWFGDDSDDYDPADARVTRSTLVRSYQQETLEAHVKLLAPGLYYTSAALSAGPSATPATSVQPLAAVGRTSNLTHSTRRQQEMEAAASAALASVDHANAAALADQSSEPVLPQPSADADRRNGMPPALDVPASDESDSPPFNGRSAGNFNMGSPTQSPFGSFAHEPFTDTARELNAGETGPLAAVLGPGAAEDATAIATAAAVPGMMKTALQQEIAGTTGSPGEGVAANANAVAYNALDEERQRVMALYQAAVIADQNAKLSVFTTRPAIFAPPFNWLTEFMSTVMLVLSVKLMAAQMLREGLPGKVLQPLYVGLLIVCAVLGLGGPTGFSVNPARDLGPRIAHWLLPIPNKGPSEWYYGWIPVTAAFAGGAAGAGLFMAINLAIW